MRRSASSHRINGRVIRCQSFVFIAPLCLILVFVLAACGSNGGTTTGSGSTPTTAPTVAATSTSAVTGCPNNAVVNPAQTKPNVTIQLANTNSTITAHNGDLIEVRLPFGHQWSGPAASQGILQLQTPVGYAVTADKVCIWHFVAKGTGTVALAFEGKPICKVGQLCPLYIMSVPFTVDVK